MGQHGIGLNLELLEDRITPSSTTPTMGEPGGLLPPVMLPPIVVPPIIISPGPIQQTQHLVGNGQAFYVVDQPNPDVGKTFHIVGTAGVLDHGEFLVTGTLQSVGSVADGEAEGKLTFRNARGSFTIEVQGPMQPGFATLPQQFQYHVIGGTGAYAHLQAQGDIVLTRHSDSDHDAGTMQIHFKI